MVDHFVTIFLAAVGVAAARWLRYMLQPTGATAPAGRSNGTIVHDPAGQQLFLFGGSAPGARNDRWGHTLVLDAARRRLVLFGGQASGFFNDLWTYDIARGNWRRAEPPIWAFRDLRCGSRSGGDFARVYGCGAF